MATENILQDDLTPVCGVDGLVTALIENLMEMTFGNKQIGPQLLQPSAEPLYLLQQFMTEIVQDQGVADHDMTPEAFDEAWDECKCHGAKVTTAWSARFPARKLLSALLPYDSCTGFGRLLAKEKENMSRCNHC